MSQMPDDFLGERNPQTCGFWGENILQIQQIRHHVTVDRVKKSLRICMMLPNMDI